MCRCSKIGLLAVFHMLKMFLIQIWSKSCLRCFIWEMSRKVLTMCCLLTLEKSYAAMMVMIMASLEYWQYKQIVFCATFHSISHVRRDCLCFMHAGTLTVSSPTTHILQPNTGSLCFCLNASYICIFSYCVIDFSKWMLHKRTHSFSLWSTLFFWVCVLNNHNERDC